MMGANTKRKTIENIRQIGWKIKVEKNLASDVIRWIEAGPFLFCVLVVLLFGCSQIHVKDIRARNASNLLQLEMGMSKQAVLEIMGSDTETVTEEVYYQGVLAGYRELEVSNPYKSEIKKIRDRTYEILYYYADIFGMRMGYWDASYRDRKVTDNSLTPLVFENDRLIGWGREFADRKELIKEETIDKTNWMLWGR